MDQPAELPTRDQALAKAIQLAAFAEGETDLARMERLTELADLWVGIAHMQQEQEAA